VFWHSPLWWAWCALKMQANLNGLLHTSTMWTFSSVQPYTTSSYTVNWTTFYIVTEILPSHTMYHLKLFHFTQYDKCAATHVTFGYFPLCKAFWLFGEPIVLIFSLQISQKYLPSLLWIFNDQMWWMAYYKHKVDMDTTLYVYVYKIWTHSFAWIIYYKHHRKMDAIRHAWVHVISGYYA
jgi:hypothetical protein